MRSALTIIGLNFLVMMAVAPLSLADPVIVHGDTCITNAVRGILGQVARGNPVEGYVGSFSELAGLMRQAGVEEQEMRESLWALSEVLKTPRSPTLKNTADSLLRASQSKDELLVCVLSPKCELAHGAAIHVKMHKTFDIIPLMNPSAASPKFRTRVATDIKTTSPPPPDLIFIGSSKRDAAAYLLHEGTHFADFKLLERWIEANQKVGMVPDELFRQFARLKEGRVQLDEGFVRAFLESRAYGAEASAADVLHPNWSDQSKATWGNGRALKAMEDLRAYGDITQPAIQALRLNDEDIFHVGQKLGTRMLETIKESEKLIAKQARLERAQSLPPRPFAKPQELGLQIQRDLPAVDDLEYEILRSMYEPPKRKWTFLSKRPTSKTTKIADAVLQEAYEEVKAAGGRMVHSDRGNRLGQFDQTGSSYFSVDSDGIAEIGLSSSADEGNLAGFMEDLRQWKAARDALMAKGLRKKDAALRAYIEGLSPERNFRGILNHAAAEIQAPGFYNLENTVRKYHSGEITRGDVENLVTSITGAHVNVIRRTILMRREILRRLETRGIRLDGRSLNFAIEGHVGPFPEGPRLPESGKTQLLGHTSTHLSTETARLETKRLMDLYRRLEHQAEKVADHALEVNHTIRKTVAERLDEIGDASEAAKVSEAEKDIFGQFIFQYGRRLDVEGTAGPLKALLEQRLAQKETHRWDTASELPRVPNTPDTGSSHQ